MDSANKKYETLGVLAGAYLGKSPKLDKILTHVVEIDEQGQWLRVLCKRVQLDNICEWTETPDAVATCPTCARRDPRSR